MATTKQIKAAIKAVLDATGQLGSVYTVDVERIERPQPAYVTMWHDGGSQTPEAGTTVERTTRLLVRLITPRPPVGTNSVDSLAALQEAHDDNVDLCLEALRAAPTLDTGSGPLVLSCMVESWDVKFNDAEKRMDSEFVVVVTRQEG